MSAKAENSNTDHHNHSRNGARVDPKKKGFVTTLSPKAQVSKVVADIKNLKGGYHLRNWSASARKELAPLVTIKLEVKHEGKTVDVNVPKLGLLVASPIFQIHMQEHPEDKHLRFVHEHVALGSIKTIAEWLRKICTEHQYTDLPVSQNVEEAMQLRLTARTLGMSQYVVHITERYIYGLGTRAPSPTEIPRVTEYTRDGAVTDPVLDALANRLSFLCRYHWVSLEEELMYAKVLAKQKSDRLFDAIKEDTVKSIAERGWNATYNKAASLRTF